MSRKSKKNKSAKKFNNWDPDLPLPQTHKWQPRKDKTDTLQEAFLKRCVNLEKKILLKIVQEKEANINNFDSGAGVEDILREELKLLIPKRYDIQAGVINDRLGNTAGDCELIIFNDEWFPSIKAGATPASRRVHLPIEGVYAVCEVKQSIDFQILDEAMKKLVTIHRLYRPPTNANRVVENWEYDGCFHGLKNPLYSAVIATSLSEKIELDNLVERFFDINKTLKRQEVIRCLCVLDRGTLTWSFVDLEGEFRPALFMRDDLFHPIIPVYHKVPKSPSALYSFVSDLLLHLYQSVLAAEDVAFAYGPKELELLRPTSSEISLQPDSEWIEKLKWKNDKDGELVPTGRNIEGNEDD
jgi:hypothetical protein